LKKIPSGWLIAALLYKLENVCFLYKEIRLVYSPLFRGRRGHDGMVVCFLRVLRFPPPIKRTYRHDITEILLKMELNTVPPAPTPFPFILSHFS